MPITKERLFLRSSIFGCLFCLFGAGLRAYGQEKTLVLQNLSFQKGDRIESIELFIKAGSFVEFDPLPIGWYLIIDNDPSQQTSIKGDARVGTAALEVDDLLRLHIRVRRIQYETQPFSISGTLTVTKDFVNERRILLGKKNFGSSAKK